MRNWFDGRAVTPIPIHILETLRDVPGEYREGSNIVGHATYRGGSEETSASTGCAMRMFSDGVLVPLASTCFVCA